MTIPLLTLQMDPFVTQANLSFSTRERIRHVYSVHTEKTCTCYVYRLSICLAGCGVQISSLHSENALLQEHLRRIIGHGVNQRYVMSLMHMGIWIEQFLFDCKWAWNNPEVGNYL